MIGSIEVVVLTEANHQTCYFCDQHRDMAFFLPAIKQGLCFEFVMATNNELTVTGEDGSILLDGRSGITTIAYRGHREKIGSRLRVNAVKVGDSVVWLAQNLGGTNMHAY